jgi:hypothetical protein
MTPPARFPDGGVSRAFVIAAGDQQLKVAIDPRGTDGKPIADEVRSRIAKALKDISGPESLFHVTDKASEAEWVVRVDGSRVFLATPEVVRSADKRLPAGPRYGPAPIDGQLGAWLQPRLDRIARAENLKRLAAAGADTPADEGAVKLDVKIGRRKDAADRTGSIPVAWPAPSMTAFDGDRFVVTVTNRGKQPLDVTVLYIDSDFGIHCLYPRKDGSNRIRSTESELLPFTCDAETTGREHFVVIALKASGPVIDFRHLVQPTMERAKEQAVSRGDDWSKTMGTPLGRLLKRGMYSPGASRDPSVEEQESYAISLIPVDVRSQKRPATAP